MSKKNLSIERKAKVVLNLLCDPAVIVDEKGCLLVVNNVLEEETGLSQKEIIGKSFLEVEILPAESKKALLENFMKRMQGLLVKPYEVYFKDKTGKDKWVEIKGKKIKYAEQPADLVVLHDITRRKENDRRLKEYAENMEALVNEKVRKIKETAEKLKSILYSSPDAITVFDINAKITECNQAKVTIFGFSSKDELIGKSAFELISPKDHQKMSTRMEEILKTGKLKNIEYTALTKDGREFPAESSAGILKDAEGNSVGFVAITKDITERRKIEETLKASEAKYLGLINGMNDTVWVIDFNSKFIDVNDAAVKVLGYSREELLSMGPSDIDTSLSAEEISTLCRKMPAHQVQFFETSHTTKDGKKIPVEISSSLVTYQGKQAVLSIARDLTNRKEMEKMLVENEKRAGTIVKNALIGIATSGRDKRFISANPAFCRILGFTEEELQKLTFRDITHPEDLKESIANMKALEKGDTVSFMQQKRYIRKDGTVIYGRIMVSAIRDESDKPILFVAELEDITESVELRKKIEEYNSNLEKLVEERTAQLKQAQTKLLRSERMAAIGELAGMVGHDLRNPLTGIRNAAYYLRVKQDSISEENRKKLLKVIDSAIAHADKIINDLQDYSREMHLELVDCSPRLIMKEALTLVQVPGGVKITDKTLEEPVIRADKAKMVRVFINIIRNAIDAMPKGGTLQIKSIQTDDNVEISFADTGIGMSEEMLSKLFSPMVTTKAQGMGFGLAICKRIVEAHGGKITVETVLRKGSTFTVAMPINPGLANGGEET
jgi:PAS domain S-box-containing protein